MFIAIWRPVVDQFKKDESCNRGKTAIGKTRAALVKWMKENALDPRAFVFYDVSQTEAIALTDDEIKTAR